jgi:hypothetical protein
LQDFQTKKVDLDKEFTQLGQLKLKRRPKNEIAAQEKIVNELQAEVNDLAKIVNDKIKNSYKDNITFCHPMPGEEIIDEDEFESLAEKAATKKVYEDLKRDGKIEVNLKRKEQIKNELLSQAAVAAAQHKAKLEIEGSADPLNEAKTWYNEKVKEIEKEFE